MLGFTGITTSNTTGTVILTVGGLCALAGLGYGVMHLTKIGVFSSTRDAARALKGISKEKDPLKQKAMIDELKARIAAMQPAQPAPSTPTTDAPTTDAPKSRIIAPDSVPQMVQ